MIEFANWLADNGASQKLLENYWIVPVVQCIHILAISALMGGVLMINLRVLNLAGKGQTMTATARRFVPWIWWGVAIALITDYQIEHSGVEWKRIARLGEDAVRKSHEDL